MVFFAAVPDCGIAMNKKQSTVFGALTLGLLLAIGVESFAVVSDHDNPGISAESSGTLARIPTIGDGGPPVTGLS